MKFRSKNDEEIKIDMTPMIDIVFQLLVFFIMTFKIVPMEGDFNIRMPLMTDKPRNMEDFTPTVIKVVLSSNADGGLTSIDVDNEAEVKTFDEEDKFDQLTKFVQESLASEGDPSTADDMEVEFDIKYSLHYKHTVRAIEAVSGTINADKTINKLIKKIKFKDNSGGG